MREQTTTKVIPITLADRVYRLTLNPKHFVPHTAKIMREQSPILASAHRFTLDTPMSAFLADLADAAWRSFTRWKGEFRGSVTNDEMKHMQKRLRVDLIDQLRHLARPPFPVTWIEFDATAHHHRVDELEGRRTHDPTIPLRLGFLIMTDTKDPNIFFAIPWGEWKGGSINTPGLGYVWSVTDDPIPDGWNTLPVLDGGDTLSQEAMTGFQALSVPYASPCLGLLVPFHSPEDITQDELLNILDENRGTLRHLWALLAALNDTPTRGRHMPSAGKFFARGKIRDYLPYTSIHLNLPKSTGDVTKAARSIIARVRKRAHNVRGFFRRNYRRPDDHPEGCKCDRCVMWVRAHVRGDASLGWVRPEEGYTIHHPV